MKKDNIFKQTARDFIKSMVLITVLFALAKILGIVNVPWFLVFIPFWLPLSVLVLIVASVTIFLGASLIVWKALDWIKIKLERLQKTLNKSSIQKESEE